MPLDPAALDNILQTVKQGIGIQPTDTTFDATLTIHINSAMMVLNQLGVGPAEVFVLGVDGSELWSAFLPDGDDATLALVKTYVILKVQSLFDPPTSGIVMTAHKELLQEFASRLVYQVDSQTAV